MTSHQTPSGNISSVHAVVPSTISTTEHVSTEGSSKGEEMAVTVQAAAIPSAVPKDDNIPAPRIEDQAEPGTKSTAEEVSTEAPAKEEERTATMTMETLTLQTAAAPSITSDDEIPVPDISEREERAESERLTDVDPSDQETVTSVSSMPATMPASVGLESPSQRPRAQADADSGSVMTAPPVLLDTHLGDYIGLDDVIASPHRKNAIVERSPGGRYVRFMEKLGSGASKEVYRAYDTQEGIEVAWNVINLAGVPKNERNRIVNEVRLLERLHHHNIISFHGSWVNRELQQVNFVTEILSSGTLKSFITKVQVIRLKIAKRWAFQILKGLEYLHSQDPPVIHRDLKCDNIFINGTSGDLRIGDLGLSTVHRNGKVLSVLGTPEFMAPDMYEEESYDEKVDIYAFGMCLLEIFTKEIPYKECSNPAQIYKKVSRGDPPGSLKRLKSQHAREFIELCLGHKDEDGNFIRPSTTELLAHDFLQKRENDDDEVEVDPPIQERTIRETTTYTSSPGIRGGSKQSQPETATKENASPHKVMQSVRSTSLEEDESYTFEEMPDSEVNIRKVKVMMGRGQELKEDDEPVIMNETQTQPPGGMDPSTDSQMLTASALPTASAGPIGTGNPPAVVSASNQGEPSNFHYLVAAAVIEKEQTIARPYENDILKLVVTLPVEGQTQNVQFDFHLVQDDPVQVAKEMVDELAIPHGAVLEISETISGLARAARVKQDKGQQSQGHVRAQSQGMLLQQPPMGQMSDFQGMSDFQNQNQGMSDFQNQNQGMSDFQSQGMMQSATHQSMPEYISTQPMVQPHAQHSQHVQQPIHQQGVPVQDQTVQMHAQQMGQHAPMPQMQMQPQSMNRQNSDPNHSPETQPHPAWQAPLQAEIPMQNPPSHIVHNQHQQVQINPHLDQTSNGDLQTGYVPSDANIHVPQPQYGHSVPVQNHPPNNIRSVSNAGQSESQSQAPSATFGHAPGQHVQMPPQQVGQNSGAAQSDAQGQSSASTYGHPPQSHIQMQAPAMGQGMQMHNTGGRSPAEAQGQHAATQYTHNSQHGQSHVLQQSMSLSGHPNSNAHQPPQQMHTYGQGVASQQQQQLPLVPSLQQQSQHQQVPSLQQQQVGQHQQLPGSQQQQPQMPGIQQQSHHSQPQLPIHQQQQQSLQAGHQQQQQQVGQQQQLSGQQQPQMPGIQQQSQQSLPQLPILQQQQQSLQAGHQMPSNLGPWTQQVVSAAGPSNLAGRAETTGVATQAAQGPNTSPQLQTSTAEVNVVSGSSNLQQPGPASGGPASRDNHVNGVLEVPAIGDDADLLDDELLASELRELDEDFKKNMMRAKKVFDSRMDNMQRSHYQREAQHQKTLVKHQKERSEFEKRLQKEEIEQNRRIEQLQKEWDRLREAVRQKQLADAANAAETPPDQSSWMPISNPSGSDGSMSEK